MIESRRKAIGWESSQVMGGLSPQSTGDPGGNLGNLKGILLSSDGAERRDVWR